MTNDLKRRRILKALQAECAALCKLTNKLEIDLKAKHMKKVA